MGGDHGVEELALDHGGEGEEVCALLLAQLRVQVVSLLAQRCGFENLGSSLTRNPRSGDEGSAGRVECDAHRCPEGVSPSKTCDPWQQSSSSKVPVGEGCELAEKRKLGRGVGTAARRCCVISSDPVRTFSSASITGCSAQPTSQPTRHCEAGSAKGRRCGGSRKSGVERGETYRSLTLQTRLSWARSQTAFRSASGMRAPAKGTAANQRSEGKGVRVREGSFRGGALGTAERLHTLRKSGWKVGRPHVGGREWRRGLVIARILKSLKFLALEQVASPDSTGCEFTLKTTPKDFEN